MGFRISTNLPSLAAQRYMGDTQRENVKAISELSTGSRFAGSSSNAAEFAISEHLHGQIKGLSAARMNAEQATSFVQVAEGGLNEQNNILIRLRELAIQAASDTFSDEERGFLQQEYGELLKEYDRIAKTTQYGSQKLLNNEDSKDYEFHVGPYKGDENIIRFTLDTNTSASATEIEDTSVADQDDAEDSLENIDSAITKLAQVRSHFGATASRLEYAKNNIDAQVQNLSEARSHIADTDVADAVTRFTTSQIRQSFQASVLAQANQSATNALKLLP